jgi:hypothetical protein
MNDSKVKKTHYIDIGQINRNWEYSKDPRLEGLLKQLKYIKWTNVSKF